MDEIPVMRSGLIIFKLYTFSRTCRIKSITNYGCNGNLIMKPLYVHFSLREVAFGTLGTKPVLHYVCNESKFQEHHALGGRICVLHHFIIADVMDVDLNLVNHDL